jgi:hypothetical protein
MLSLDYAEAERVLREEAAKALTDPGPVSWCEKIEKLSRLCIEGRARTHIAFLGTILLARSVDHRADVKWIKPTHSQGAPFAFSARTLSERVLVPVAAELGVHLGATAAQPLNNQPYFRMTFLGDGTPVLKRARPAFDFMLDLVRQIEAMADEKEAREALRAFVSVRKRDAPVYAAVGGGLAITREGLAAAIQTLVSENSEGGKRAQAAVAGLLDVTFGPDRVITDRINSPSRRYPGDVCVLTEAGGQEFDKAFEVKDKPAGVTEVQIFVRKCLEFGVRETAYVMVGAAQGALDEGALLDWAARSGLGLTIFRTWSSLVHQCLFWSPTASPDAAIEAAECIRERLIEIEAAPDTVIRWDAILRA